MRIGCERNIHLSCIIEKKRISGLRLIQDCELPLWIASRRFLRENDRLLPVWASHTRSRPAQHNRMVGQQGYRELPVKLRKHCLQDYTRLFRRKLPSRKLGLSVTHLANAPSRSRPQDCVIRHETGQDLSPVLLSDLNSLSCRANRSRTAAVVSADLQAWH